MIGRLHEGSLVEAQTTMFRTEPRLWKVSVSGKTRAAGKIEANVWGAIQAAIALPIAIDLSSPSRTQASLV